MIKCYIKARTPKCARDTKSSSMRAMREAQKEESGTDVKRRGARRIGIRDMVRSVRASKEHDHDSLFMTHN